MYPGSNPQLSFALEPLRDSIVRGVRRLLLILLGAVGMAVLMGGWNRVIGFPRAKRGAPEQALMVLRIESLVLAGVLVLAAALTAQQPPTQ